MINYKLHMVASERDFPGIKIVSSPGQEDIFQARLEDGRRIDVVGQSAFVLNKLFNRLGSQVSVSELAEGMAYSRVATVVSRTRRILPADYNIVLEPLQGGFAAYSLIHQPPSVNLEEFLPEVEQDRCYRERLRERLFGPIRQEAYRQLADVAAGRAVVPVSEPRQAAEESIEVRSNAVHMPTNLEMLMLLRNLSTYPGFLEKYQLLEVVRIWEGSLAKEAFGELAQMQTLSPRKLQARTDSLVASAVSKAGVLLADAGFWENHGQPADSKITLEALIHIHLYAPSLLVELEEKQKEAQRLKEVTRQGLVRRQIERVVRVMRSKRIPPEVYIHGVTTAFRKRKTEIEEAKRRLGIEGRFTGTNSHPKITRAEVGLILDKVYAPKGQGFTGSRQDFVRLFEDEWKRQEGRE